MIKNIENDATYKSEINVTMAFIRSLAAWQEKYEQL